MGAVCAAVRACLAGDELIGGALANFFCFVELHAFEALITSAGFCALLAVPGTGFAFIFGMERPIPTLLTYLFRTLLPFSIKYLPFPTHRTSTKPIQNQHIRLSTLLTSSPILAPSTEFHTLFTLSVFEVFVG